MPTAGARVQYQALKDHRPRSSRARSAISEAITWCPVLLPSAVAVRAAVVYLLEPAPGGRALNAMASVLHGNVTKEN